MPQNLEQYITFSHQNCDTHPSLIKSEEGEVLIMENVLPNNIYNSQDKSVDLIYNQEQILTPCFVTGDSIVGSYFSPADGYTYFFVHNSDPTLTKIIRVSESNGVEIVIQGYPLFINSKVTGVSAVNSSSDNFLGFADNTYYGRFIDVNRGVRTGKRTRVNVYFGKPDSKEGTIIFKNGQEYYFGYTLPDGTNVAPALFYTASGVENDLINGVKAWVSAFNLAFSPSIATASYCGCGEAVIECNAAYVGTVDYKAFLYDISTIIPPNGSGVMFVYDNIYPNTIEDFNVIRAKYQPRQQPEVSYGQDSSRNENYVYGYAWQFAYCFLYRNGIKGTLSPYSAIATPPSNCTGNEVVGFNYIEIDFTGAQELKTGEFVSELEGVDIMVRNGNNGEWTKIITLKPCEFGVERNFVRWYNDTLIEGADPIWALKQYEDCPIIHQAEENATPQNMEDVRTFLGNGVYGYDNLCPEVNVGLQTIEGQTCSALYDLTIRAKIINPYIDPSNGTNGKFRTQVIWKDTGEHDNPDFGDGYAVFGGIGTSLAGTVNGIDDDYKQVLPDACFYCNIIGTDFIGEFVQNRPDPSVYPNLEYYNYDKGVYLGNNSTQRDEIRNVIDDDLVWLECTIKNVPAGKYQIQMVSHWCSKTGAYIGGVYDISAGSGYKKTSTYCIGVGSDAFAKNEPCSYIPQRVIEVDLPYTAAGPNIQYDIFTNQDQQFVICDLSDVRMIATSMVIDGYYYDSLNGSTAALDLEKGICAELQGFVTEQGTCPFWAMDLSPGSRLVTDHNGFMFWTNSTPILTPIRGRGDDSLFTFTDSKYEGTLQDLRANTLQAGKVDLQTVGAIGLRSFIFPRYLNDGTWLPNTVELTVNDLTTGYPISGVLVAPFMCQRAAVTDFNGNVSILVYPFDAALWDLSPPTEEYRGDIAPSSDSCCIDLTGAQSVVWATWSGTTPSGQLYISDILAESNFSQGQATWLVGGGYRVGLVYYDKQNRSTFVQWNDSMKFRIPFYDVLTTSRAFPFLEIVHLPPQNADIVSYQVVITKSDLKLKVQTVIGDAKYYVFYKSDTDKDETSYGAGDANEIHIPLTPMTYFNVQHGQTTVGYVYEKGDRLRLVANEGNTFPLQFIDLEIVGQVGDSVVVRNQAGLPEFVSGMVIGIYRINDNAENPYYYEFAQRWAIYEDNGVYYHSGGQSYGGVVAQDQNSIQPAILALPNGDTYERDRIMQDGATGQIYRPSVQSLHMSDFYVSDSWAMGRWNIINLNAKQQRIQSVRFSNPYRPYAHYNGLCSFDAGNSRIIPFQISGEITALRYAGGVMLVLCETRLVSLYIGERIITSAEGAETLATSNSVIGGYNVAETVYKFGGCIHPESIVVVGGHAYWYSSIDGAVIRYASNAPFPISSYGMESIFTSTADRYDKDEFVIACYDLITNCYQIRVISEKYPLINFWSDINKGRDTIFCYNINKERWTHTLRVPTAWIAQGKRGSIFANDTIVLYEWDTKTEDRGLLMGIEVEPSILLSFNPSPSIEKAPKYIKTKTFYSVTNPSIWKAQFKTYTPQGYVQQSLVEENNFIFRNNEYIATVLRDSTDTTVANPLLNGGILKATYMLSCLTTAEKTKLSLIYAAFGYTTAGK